MGITSVANQLPLLTAALFQQLTQYASVQRTEVFHSMSVAKQVKESCCLRAEDCSEEQEQHTRRVNSLFCSSATTSSSSIIKWRSVITFHDNHTELRRHGKTCKFCLFFQHYTIKRSPNYRVFFYKGPSLKS